MASQTPSNDVPAEDAVNLQIVSPSVGVNRPLLFPATPSATTIKALKGMIRGALPIRPADESQRLIYRGKALLRETDSLLDVMGAENIRSADQHTIHLVLRDLDDGSLPTVTSTLHSTASTAQQQPRQPLSIFDQLGAGIGRPQVPGTAPNAAQQPHLHGQPRMPSPAPLSQQLPAPAAAAFQQQHQQLTGWLNQVQRDAMTRTVGQNQRGRAQAGMRGIADPRDSSSRRGSPAPTHTIYRETRGPNGNSYHVETIIRNGAPATGAQNGALNLTDIQNLVREADSGNGAAAMGAAMQRTASGASVPPRSATNILNMASSPPQQASQPQQGLDLYLLSSPDGPRGILINNSTMESYYTPRAAPQPAPQPAPRPRARITVRDFLMTPPGPDDDELFAELFDPAPAPAPAPAPTRRRNFQGANTHHHPAPVPAQAAAPVPPPVAAPIPAMAQPNVAMPPAPAQAPWFGGWGQLAVRIAPHFWSIARLAFFVWLFVGPNSSWTRWFVVVTMAVFVFVLGTGAMDGMGEHIWRPMLRHLESLFPTLNGQQRRPGTEAANQAPGAEPNPTDMAARLVADRNRRQPWLSEQVRRLERAGLLFLASIAPGVAERHIANLEEEARREERLRREAEEAAAAAAAAEEERNAKEEAEKNGGVESAESSAAPGTKQQESAAAQENRSEQEPAREPLAAM